MQIEIRSKNNNLFPEIVRRLEAREVIIVPTDTTYTLVDFTLDRPTILKYGPVSVDDLRPILPDIELPCHLRKEKGNKAKKTKKQIATREPRKKVRLE